MQACDIKQAVSVIAAGGLLAYPTEAVYGLGCDPRNVTAIKRLLALKQRDHKKGLILIAADESQLTDWIQALNQEQKNRIGNSWPGPTTWLIPAQAHVSSYLRGEHDKLAVRVTKHPVARALCQQCGHALVSTSANLSGMPPAKSAYEVSQQFDHKIDGLLDGALGGRTQPSNIIDITNGNIIRA